MLSGLAPSYARGTARANYLLVDAFPATTYELLPEWQSTLGLPDQCAGVAPTIPLRQAQLLARFVGVGARIIASLTAFAANLGYTVTINQFVKRARYKCVRACGRRVLRSGLELRVAGECHSQLRHGNASWHDGCR
ncbi:putative phage tail protein [Paraburkholderia caledonica]|uniref:putative phage tail protein n=1 Tax=Paraburkholderia caledonica TaxID=134536 RepID=UPI0038B78C28